MISEQDSQALEDHFRAEKHGGRAAKPSSPSQIASPGDEASSLKSKDSKLESPFPKTKLGWRFYAAFTCLCVINLICAIDATILAVALPAIANDLNGTAIEAFWAGTSFLLTSTVFQPTFTSFSHIFGRKPVLLLALTFFAMGALVAAVARNIATLLIGRTVQGIGGGGLSALTYVLISDMVSLRERGRWFAWISLMWAIGSVCGPVIGGAFANNSDWRWIFWLNVPFCIFAFIGIPLSLRLAQKVGSVFEKLKAVDWIGSFLFVSSITSFLVPLTWGGIQFEWDSWHTILPMCVGVAGLLGFLAYAKYIAQEPLIRGRIFASSTAKVGYFGTFIHGIIVWALLYYMPLYYEVVKDYSPVMSGVAMFPLTFTTAPAGVVTGLIITKTGKYKPSIWIAWAITTIGMGILTILQRYTSTPGWVFLSLVPGIGLGILYSSQSFGVQAAASNDDLPFAAAMYSFFRSLGQTFGVAIGGVIFQNMLKQKLLHSANVALSSNADKFATDASALVQIIRVMPVSDVRDGLVGTYVDSLRIVWAAMCGLAGIMTILSFVFTKELGLDRIHETDQGFVYEVQPIV